MKIVWPITETWAVRIWLMHYFAHWLIQQSVLPYRVMNIWGDPEKSINCYCDFRRWIKLQKQIWLLFMCSLFQWCISQWNLAMIMLLMVPVVSAAWQQNVSWKHFRLVHMWGCFLTDIIILLLVTLICWSFQCFVSCGLSFQLDFLSIQ